MELWELAWFEVSTVQNKRQVHIDILYIVTNIDHVQESVFEGQLDGGLMTFKHYQTNNIHVTVEDPLEAMKAHNNLKIQSTWRCDKL
jgi:CRISPR/Cas system-associated endoribonuclease Cas2